MTGTWPQFITKDLGDTEEDAAEMVRRWDIYNREMKALIEAGGVHQDDDGWWVETATGKLIGPDPEIERPLTADDFARMRPMKEVLPDVYESIQRARGRPRVEKPKEAVTLRIDPETLARFKAKGKNWRAEMAKVLDAASS